MKIKTNNFLSTLNKISIWQLLIPLLISIFPFIKKDYCFFSGLLISGFSAATYTQLIKLSNLSKLLFVFGFPIRILLVGLPTAILVHKLHSNLLALFIGYVISQVAYFFFIWKHTKKEIE